MRSAAALTVTIIPLAPIMIIAFGANSTISLERCFPKCSASLPGGSRSLSGLLLNSSIVRSTTDIEFVQPAVKMIPDLHKVFSSVMSRSSNLRALCVSRPSVSSLFSKLSCLSIRSAASATSCSIKSSCHDHPRQSAPVSSWIASSAELTVELVDVPTDVFGVDDAVDPLHRVSSCFAAKPAG